MPNQVLGCLRHLSKCNKNGYFSRASHQTANKSFIIVVDEFDLPKSDFSTLLKSCPEKEKRPEFPKRMGSNTLKREMEVDQRQNLMNIQMLSNNLRKQIFKDKHCDNYESDVIRKAQDELKKKGLWNENINFIPDVDLKLPELFGNNISEHFQIIGDEQAGPYRKLLLDFIKAGVPPTPETWLLNKGWTMYKPGQDPVSVDCPLEHAFVLDVEVCRSVGEAPTLATAVSTDAWYGWVCADLTEQSNPVPKTEYSTNDLIPLESKLIDKLVERIVVGHNVSYDRARVKEQYYLENSALRFLDTMSLHICVGGVTSYQKTLLKTRVPDEDDSWREYSSLNSLSAVHKLYCKTEISKEERNVFVEGNIQEVRNDFQNLMKYCSNDVMATYNVLQKLLVIFLERFKHPVTLAGMLEMNSVYLPINKNWKRFLSEAEQTFQEYENEVKLLLIKKCNNACVLLHNDEYKKDLWMWDEDWQQQELKMNKSKKIKKKELLEQVVEDIEDEDELDKKYQELFDMKANLPIRSPHLPGYPLWYRKLCDKPKSEDWIPGPQLISTNVKVTPKLLNLMWENYPLHYVRKYGWGLLVADLNLEAITNTDIPFDKLKELTLKNMSVSSDIKNDCFVDNINELVEESIAKNDYWEQTNKKFNYSGSAVYCNHMIDDCCYFLKLPHKNGNNNNVGNPLAKDFLKTFTSRVLSSQDKSAVKILTLSRMLSYWRNNCERIVNQLTVWLQKKEIKNLQLTDGDVYGAILPLVVVCGTLTRRAMEPTWMTASNAYPDRIGSELRSMVQAPPGYNIVGADVDSQELWIASIIGDSYFAKQHGATPFGWMTLSGHKSNGTDMHSVTAKAAGITRDHAKVLNYARIYGAGQRFTQRLLKQFNPSLAEQEAKNKAQKMFLLTKGKKCFKIKPEFAEMLDNAEEYYSSFGALKIAKRFGKPVDEIFEKGKWMNGTESAMFNRLEEIATSKYPVTPFLGCRLSRALEPKFENDDSYLTTKINWVVQSGAVDFLHLMLVCMRWLTNGQVRFCLSFHDEVRYLVKSEVKYQTALALHITNLLTRSFCAYKLGLYDLPQSVAFFTSVEVDTVLRKEADLDCVTPSNPHGLRKGYNIEPGESLNIYQTVDKSGGSLSVFDKKKRSR